MSKYIVIYQAPAEVMAQMGNISPEERAEGMKPWMAWAEKCGDHLIDLGTPLVGGVKLHPGGVSEASTSDVAGYSVLEAASMDDAKSLLEGHPHLGWNADCDIEVYESVPM